MSHMLMVPTAQIDNLAVTTGKIALLAVADAQVAAAAAIVPSKLLTTNFNPNTNADGLGSPSGPKYWDAFVRRLVATGLYRLVANTVLNASAAIATGDQVSGYYCDNTSLAILNITLPAATDAANNGLILRFKRLDASAFATVINRTGADTIDGATTYTLAAQYATVELQCVGSAWHVWP